MKLLNNFRIIEHATEFENLQSGYEAAEAESMRHEMSERDKTVRFNERSGKSAVRGAVALHKVRLDNSKSKLESNLEILRRKEAQRRGHEVDFFFERILEIYFLK